MNDAASRRLLDIVRELQDPRPSITSCVAKFDDKISAFDVTPSFPPSWIRVRA